MAGVASTYFLALELRDRLAIANANLANASKVLAGLKLEQTRGHRHRRSTSRSRRPWSPRSMRASRRCSKQLRQSIDALAILIGSTPEGVDVTHGSAR